VSVSFHPICLSIRLFVPKIVFAAA
jgi:hypothetical protein